MMARRIPGRGFKKKRKSNAGNAHCTDIFMGEGPIRRGAMGKNELRKRMCPKPSPDKIPISKLYIGIHKYFLYNSDHFFFIFSIQLEKVIAGYALYH